jgi:hypothetical protein
MQLGSRVRYGGQTVTQLTQRLILVENDGLQADGICCAEFQKNLWRLKFIKGFFF